MNGTIYYYRIIINNKIKTKREKKTTPAPFIPLLLLLHACSPTIVDFFGHYFDERDGMTVYRA